MQIPDDINVQVLNLATALLNSFESADRRAYWRHYNELRELCESEAAAGRAHPFLFETLGDFTDDDAIAIGLYQQGLSAATQPEAAAYRASIQLAIAERYKSLGDSQLAYDYALRANAVAKCLDDLELRRQISEFLLDASGG